MTVNLARCDAKAAIYQVIGPILAQEQPLQGLHALVTMIMRAESLTGKGRCQCAALLFS
jgi:hypothetical protein